MAKASSHPAATPGKRESSTKSRVTAPKLSQSRKTPMARLGMSLERLLRTAGSIPTKLLDAMEKAIDEGCERGESHGQ